MAEEVEFGEGAPRSRRFGDVYFSAEGGLAESRLVYLEGAGLPDAFAGRDHFTVAELGFGAGLNVLALIDLWARARPSPAARLSIFSVEGFLMSRGEAARALSAFPELASLAAPLLTAWPAPRGWRRIDWPRLGVVLDVAAAEAADALSDWSGAADAWFLDGFAPAKNPEIWRDEVLDAVRARSAPGARLASFTVAGAVRRGLQARGFEVERRPGFGRKAERLTGRLPGAPSPRRLPSVAVVGGGIAGSWLVHALAAAGARPRLFEAEDLGAGASGNPSALVSPRLDAGDGPDARLFAQAFRRAVDRHLAVAPEAVLARGVLRFEARRSDPGRLRRLAVSDLFAPGELELLEPAQAAARLGEPEAPAALFVRDALVVRPDRLLPRLAAAAELRRAVVAAAASVADGVRLLGERGEDLGVFDRVVVAAGIGTRRIWRNAPLEGIRGQISLAPGAALRGAPATFGGYAVPAPKGLLFGATHDRDAPQEAPTGEGHARNLAGLARRLPTLAAGLAASSLEGRVSIRAATRDHLPLSGPVPDADGVFVLTGFGGRGFTWAPVLAEALADGLLGRPAPLPASLAARLDPRRARTAHPTARGAALPDPPSARS